METYLKCSAIGKGAFGFVYLAKSPHNRFVVLKEIILAGYDDNEIEKKCKEASLLSSLSHPNVIGYYGHWVKDDVLTIAMEYAAFGNLNEFVTDLKGPLEEHRVFDIFAQVVLAVVYIHDLNIIHRDLTARNILICKGTRVKISDFGISKRLESASSNCLAGDVSYFAPELCYGTEQTKETDIWSLGCLLYLLTNLRLPFKSPTLAGLMAAILTSPPTISTQVYSKQLQTLIDSLLSHEPSLRPTAKSMLSYVKLNLYIHKTIFYKHQISIEEF